MRHFASPKFWEAYHAFRTGPRSGRQELRAAESESATSIAGVQEDRAVLVGARWAALSGIGGRG
jgi:hypothetical protein